MIKALSEPIFVGFFKGVLAMCVISSALHVHNVSALYQQLFIAAIALLVSVLILLACVSMQHEIDKMEEMIEKLDPSNNTA